MLVLPVCMSRLTHLIRGGYKYRNRAGRRCAGFHNDRVDGFSDLLSRASNATVLDIGCNRGLVALEFSANGATLVHGCDKFTDGVFAARQIFCDLETTARFEVVDLAQGYEALKAAFGSTFRDRYDIVLFLDMWHHLKQQMPLDRLADLTRQLAKSAGSYFVVRTQHFADMELLLKAERLALVHFSDLPNATGPVQIWQRK
jgi:SAM-dependent methyltransferase